MRRYSGKYFEVLLIVMTLLIVFSGTVSEAQTPLNAPGGLCVRVDRQQFLSHANVNLPDAQLLILDHSASMNDSTRSGESRFEVAQDVLRQYVRDLPEGSLVGFRVYGIDGSCNETELISPLGPLNRVQMTSIVDNMSYPDGSTPIADALSYIPSDFQRRAGTKEVLLVTDGQETCGGDPVSVANSLAGSDPNLSIHVIGFEIDDAQAQQNLRNIPRVARGVYVPVETERDLLQALSIAVRVPFYVYDGSGRYLGEGLVNRTTLAFDPGTYRVDVPDLGISQQPLTVERGRGTSLYVDQNGRTQVIQNDSLCIAEFCPDVPLPRLVVGEGGRVTYGDPRPVRVRSVPGLDGEVLTMLDLGEEFDVLDGPICVDGYLWWHVRNSRLDGWSAEGVPGNYYLEPWP